jgi:hypothetical protein
MSWCPQVLADSSGVWSSNALRFVTREEAEMYVKDLKSRWLMVYDTRVVDSPDPVNYRWKDGKLESVE